MLRSAGKLALDFTAQRDLRSTVAPELGAGSLRAWELELFGLRNETVAEAILRAWRFPYEVYVPIRDHSLQGLAMDALPTARLLNLAAGIAEANEVGLAGEAAYWEPTFAALRDEFALDDETFGEMTERIRVRFRRMRMALA